MCAVPGSSSAWGSSGSRGRSWPSTAIGFAVPGSARIGLGTLAAGPARAAMAMWYSQRIHLQVVYLVLGAAFTLMLMRFVVAEPAGGRPRAEAATGAIIRPARPVELPDVPVPRPDRDAYGLGHPEVEPGRRLEDHLDDPRRRGDRLGIAPGPFRRATAHGLAHRLPQAARHRLPWPRHTAGTPRSSGSSNEAAHREASTNDLRRLLHQLRSLPPGPAPGPGDPLTERGDCLIAYEVAGSERTYPWQRRRQAEPFDWITLFPDRTSRRRPPPTVTGP